MRARLCSFLSRSFRTQALVILTLLAALPATSQNISSLSPTSGPVGTSVTIAGSGFGASQGSSTVAFNGANASPTGWSDTSIAVPVPSGATTGNVVVTANGIGSNGVNFTVTTVVPSLISISVTPNTASISAGSVQPFDAVGTYSDNSTQDQTSTATWTSSDPTVAAIDATGKAMALDNGQVTIQATVGSVSGSAQLTVTPGQLNAVITTAYQPVNGSEAVVNGKAIAVASDGYSRFVTGDSSSNGYSDQLIYVHCLDQDCATSNTTTFNIGIPVDTYSMALGPDGFARIAYAEINNGPGLSSTLVHFIQCFDVDCNSSNDTFVDGGSDSYVTAITVGGDGTAYIAYDYGGANRISVAEKTNTPSKA